MLNISLSKNSVSPGRVARKSPTKRPDAAAPPVTATMPAQNAVKYSTEVFGHVPDGFTLENQTIHRLAYWLRKAIRAVDDYCASPVREAGRDNAIMNEKMRPVNEVFDAIKAASLDSADGIAVQMVAIADFIDWFDHESSAVEDLGAAEFRRLATSLSASMSLNDPTKRVGPLTKSRKLTRAGLLVRYHAFLVGELETLSWNLYGSRDYAMHYRPKDGAVSARVSNRSGDGANVDRRKVHPFFDESRLSTRARAVLRSLDIDTERDEEAPTKPRGR